MHVYVMNALFGQAGRLMKEIFAGEHRVVHMCILYSLLLLNNGENLLAAGVIKMIPNNVPLILEEYLLGL